MKSLRTCLLALVLVMTGVADAGAQNADAGLSAQIETSRAFFDRLNEGDIQGWLATMATDVVTHEPVGTPPNIGHDGVIAWAMRNQEMGFQSVAVEVHDIHTVPGETAVDWTTHFVLPNGDDVALDGVDIHRFDDDGTIVEVRAYFDPTPLLRLMEQ
ncbi:MAG: nuclear transport factor 2 family protein [Pseudomonadota bacterium]